MRRRLAVRRAREPHAAGVAGAAGTVVRAALALLLAVRGVAGVALVSWGAWQAWPPAGPIVAGVALLADRLLDERPGPDAPTGEGAA